MKEEHKTKVELMDEVGKLRQRISELEELEIGRNQIEEEIKQRNRELSALNAIAMVVSRSLDLDEILDNALEKVLEITNLDAGGIYLADSVRRKLDLVAYRGISEEFAQAIGKLSIDEKTLKAVMAEGKMKKFILQAREVMKNRAQMKRILSAMKKEGLSLTSGVNVLLQAKEEILGLMTLSSRAPRRFSEEENSLLIAIGHQIAVAIENSCLYEVSRRELAERKKAEERIKESLKEKEVLLQEIHHRVKNNMQIISSLLNLQSEKIKNKEMRRAFKASQSRIRSMALIHEMLYKSKDFKSVDFAPYIQNLAFQLVNVYKVKSDVVRLTLDIKDVFLDINRAITCGLIINELISNALKYAFPEGRKGEICVKVYQDKEGMYNLIISDNGVGIPKELDIHESETLGLRLVCLLTDQLSGSIALDRENGTTFKITYINPK